MNTLVIARAVAVALSGGTLVFLFGSGDWRGDNPFLVPDLILCAILVVTACLPPREAVPALIFGFGLAAGVFGSAVSAAAVQGRLGAGALVGAIVALAVVVPLMRRHSEPRLG